MFLVTCMHGLLESKKAVSAMSFCPIVMGQVVVEGSFSTWVS
jgi:hypothetical protein